MGYVLTTVKEIDPEPLHTAVVYVLASALVFHSLTVTKLEASSQLRSRSTADSLRKIANPTGNQHDRNATVSESAQ
ncbi:Auxin Efflux Carrier [Natrinema sp. J7-2]|nr:Auxin Efflux Carrier [Natrinema sp. J7-2]